MTYLGRPGSLRVRGGGAFLALTLMLTMVAVASTPEASVAAEPNVPPCPSRMTNQPLPGGDEAPTDCVGQRLLEFEPPAIPAIAFDEVLRFTWPEMCTPEQTQTSPSKCIWRWKVQLTFFTELPNGSLQQLEYAHFRIEFASDDPGCDDVRNYCEFVVRRDAAVPDEVVVVAGVYATSVFCNPPEEFTGCDADDRPWITAAQNVGEVVEMPKGIDLTLTAFDPARGHSLDRMITVAQTQTVELTLTNESDETLTGLTFTGGQPLAVDPRGTGGLRIVSGPAPPPDPALTLAPGAEKTFTFEVEATENGIAALNSQVVWTGANGVEHRDGGSLKYEIADGVEITRDVGQWLRMQAMDQLMRETFGVWYDEMAARGEDLATRLSAVFTPEERLRWFGSETGLPLTPSDLAIALLRGTAPQMIAALTPKQDLDGHTVEELENAYDRAFKAEVRKGVAKYVKGYADLAGATKKLLRDSWAESVLTANYVFGTATPDERAQFEAFAMTLIDGTGADADNLVNMVEREIPRWRENGVYAHQALEEAYAGGGVHGVLATIQKISRAFDDEAAARDELLELASSDPVAFQREWAKRDARILDKGLVPIFDTLLGGGVFKGAGLLKNVVVRGNGAAIMRTGRAAGVLTKGGTVAKGSSSAIELADDAVPLGLPNGTIAELEAAGSYLDDVEGATIVQSSDLGNVYELPNLGGVPETTLDAKAGILKSLEQEYLEKTGRQIQLAEVLKPSSALRKPGGVAKLELTAAKTGKPAMLDAGAPKDVLGEANVWTGPDPRTLAGFDDLPKLRQKAAVKEWEKAKKGWDTYHDPPPGSKEARLKQCIGQEARVPLDPEPNRAGLQRFVTAEFEEVLVTQGDARAKLIRVKKYEIEVVDTTRANQVVNRKTVVDVPEAAPQTPDADGVAMAKVVGRDAGGKPILEPLNRAEREFVMQRYIDKNVKARRLPAGTAGAINDLAEHGVTLVMDDASALAAGKLLPAYGVPFLPEGVGMAYLKRIAPFVSAKNATAAEIDAMYRQMVELVRSEGGFAQHAVVVTSDGRYLGDVPFASW